jgi:hypothetical protein
MQRGNATSDLRATRRMTPASSRSTLSPAGCPKSSLTRLKRSTSSMITPIVR